MRHAPSGPNPATVPIPSAETTFRLAEWIHSLSFDDLPEPVIRNSKKMILDTLAGSWIAVQAKGVVELRSVMERRGGSPEARVWGTGISLPAHAAALVNGVAAAAYEVDSLHDKGSVHTDIVVLPALLALAERECRSGSELIAAHAAATELLIRLGLSRKGNPGWFFTSALGVLAAAAGCAKLMGLGADGIHNAMGIAFSFSSGSQQTMVEQALTKRMQSAFAAQNAVNAAEYAALGISGVHEIVEGVCGLDALYVAGDSSVLTAGLGEDFHIDGFIYKRFPACFCTHPAIYGMMKLVTEKGLSAADVESVDVRVSPASARLVGRPYDRQTASEANAQFCLPYAVAHTLARNSFDLAALAPGNLMDREIADLAGRVSVGTHSRAEDWTFTTELSVQMRNGQRLDTRIDEMPGTTTRPFTDEELNAKAYGFLTSGPSAMTPDSARAFVNTILALEELPKIATLWDSF